MRAQDGRTALIQASWNGYSEVVKALVASGADLNAKNNVRISGWGKAHMHVYVGVYVGVMHCWYV